MLTENDIKEEISYAYLHAIASRCGFSCDRPGKDRDSVDAVVSAKGRLDPKSKILSPRIEVQLKATVRELQDEEAFTFKLSLKNYNDLRGETHLPRLLVVYLIPARKTRWVTHSEEELIIRQCAYWSNLKGRPESANSKNLTITLFRHNLLSPEILKAIMIRVSRLEEVGHEL